jgi:hypothetical protein
MGELAFTSVSLVAHATSLFLFTGQRLKPNGTQCCEVYLIDGECFEHTTAIAAARKKQCHSRRSV